MLFYVLILIRLWPRLPASLSSSVTSRLYLWLLKVKLWSYSWNVWIPNRLNRLWKLVILFEDGNDDDPGLWFWFWASLAFGVSLRISSAQFLYTLLYYSYFFDSSWSSTPLKFDFLLFLLGLAIFAFWVKLVNLLSWCWAPFRRGSLTSLVWLTRLAWLSKLLPTPAARFSLILLLVPEPKAPWCPCPPPFCGDINSTFYAFSLIGPACFAPAVAFLVIEFFRALS